jgi:hypothetical protein
VYKGKCVSTLIKGKHDTWLARGLTTYKYENEDARLYQFFFLCKQKRQFKRIMACMNLLSEQAQFYKQILGGFYSK